jgi:hypothetical protein
MLQLAEYDKNEDDNKYEAYSSASIIAGSVEGAAPEAAEAAEQRDDKYNEKDCADRHFAPKAQLGFPAKEETRVRPNGCFPRNRLPSA